MACHEDPWRTMSKTWRSVVAWRSVIQRDFSWFFKNSLLFTFKNWVICRKRVTERDVAWRAWRSGTDCEGAWMEVYWDLFLAHGPWYSIVLSPEQLFFGVLTHKYLFGNVWGMVWLGLFPIKLVIKSSSPNTYSFWIVSPSHQTLRRWFCRDWARFPWICYGLVQPYLIFLKISWGNPLVIPRWCF